MYVDFPACRCKFQGIARDVQKHLVNTKGVTCDFLMNQIGVYVERQMSGMGLLEDDGTKMFDQFRQDEFLVIQCDFSVFDFAHVQHVVDQFQQMF